MSDNHAEEAGEVTAQESDTDEPKKKVRNIGVFENPEAPVLFIEDLSGVRVSDEVTKLNLISQFPGHSNGEFDEQQIIAARLVMSNKSFARLVATLFQLHSSGYQEGLYPIYDPETGRFEYKDADGDADE